MHHGDYPQGLSEPGEEEKQPEPWPADRALPCAVLVPGPPSTAEVWAPSNLCGWERVSAGSGPPWGLGPQPALGSPLGFPKSIKTKEKLCEYLTVVIFTASAQHAAVNFGQVGKDRQAFWAGDGQANSAA